MAVSQEALTTKVVETDVTTTSWTHTCTDANLLLVFIAVNTSPSLAVSYNSVGMTLVDSQSDGASTTVYLFSLVNPSAGANTVSVSNITSGYVKAYSVSFLGADTASPLNAVAKAAGNSTAPSVGATSAVGEIVYDIVGVTDGAGPLVFTAGAGQTKVLDAGTVAFLAAAGSKENGAASVTMSWTLGASNTWGILAVSVRGSVGTLTLRPDANDGKDTWLNAGLATTNYGTDTAINSYRDGSANNKRALLEFDLTGISASSIIDSAILTMTTFSFATADQLGVYRITQAWTEAGATWNTYNGTNNWGSAGGDFNGSAYATLTPNTNAADVEYTFDITSLVQEWVSGTSSNLGMLIKLASETSNNTGSDWCSSDNATSTKRPKLVVQYHEPTGNGYAFFM